MAIAKVVTKVRLGDSNDYEYWQTQPVSARIDALVRIRREYHGIRDDDESKIELICRKVRIDDKNNN